MFPSNRSHTTFQKRFTRLAVSPCHCIKNRARRYLRSQMVNLLRYMLLSMYLALKPLLKGRSRCQPMMVIRGFGDFLQVLYGCSLKQIFRLTCDIMGDIRAIPPMSAHALSTGCATFGHSTQRTASSWLYCDPGILEAPPLGATATSSHSPTGFLQASAIHIGDLPMGTDIRVVDHLIHTYLCWHHAVFPITSYKAFVVSFEHGGRYYTGLLLNVSNPL